MAVVAEADADGCRGERPLCAAQVVGQRHLDVRGFAGDRMDGDSTGLEQRGLIGELRGILRRIRGPGVEQQAATRALRRLGDGHRRSVHGLEHQAVRNPLEGLGYLQDRQRSAVAPRGLRDGGHEVGRDERARAVVDEDRPITSRRILGIEPAHPGGGGLPAAGAALDDRGHAGGKPRSPAPLVSAIRRCNQDHALHAGCRRTRLEGPREQRPAADLRHELVGAGHSSGGAGSHDHDVRPQAAGALRGHPLVHARLGEDHPPGHGLQDARHREVDILVDQPGAALDHDHRAVVQEADALSGLLALLDDPDPQLLAGQDRRLHGVRERVDVHHPHALQLGDAVEVEVVRQDDPAALLGQLDQLRVDLGDAGGLVLDDLNRRPEIALHAVQDLQAAPAAIAPQGVRGIRDVLQLLEHEPGNDERAVHEPGLHDLRDPAVDEDAGVDHDPGTGLLGHRLTTRPAHQARTLGSRDQVEALGDDQAHHAEPQEQRDPQREPRAQRALDLGEGQAQQEAQQEADEQAEHGRDELGRGHVLDPAHEPAGRHDREVRQHSEADDHPCDRPGGEDLDIIII